MTIQDVSAAGRAPRDESAARRRARREERSTPPAGEPANDAPAADAAISAAAQAASRGVPGVRAATELRTDLIFRLRQAIAEGAYGVDPAKVAERLVDRI